MNIKEIKEMIALMNENNLTELEFEKEGMRIRLKKASASQFEVLSTTAAGESKQEIIDTRKQEPRSQDLPSAKLTKELIEIKAPMVGTFYRAPIPEAPPFVETNQVITAGQVICIIEAMKLMNEIKSEYKGKIVEILINNGQPVEYGQVIMRLEPA
ncbi:MAG: acetyl-CoA carboxylase biotin carboxyl carrier protein [Candidatus Omnitrophota bacterium]